MKLTLALSLSLIAVGDAFVFPDTRSLSRTVTTKPNGSDIEVLRGPPARPNAAFVLHAAFQTPGDTNKEDKKETLIVEINDPEDTNDEDEKESLIAEINELASAFEQVQETIQSNTKLYEQKMDDYEDDIETLKSEIDKQITGIMSRDNDIQELKVKLEAAESQLQDKNLSTSKLEDNIKILQSEIQHFKEDVGINQEFKVKLEAAESQLQDGNLSTSKFEDNIKMLQSEIQTLKEDAGIKDGKVGQLKGDLDSLKQELEKKESEVKYLSTSSSAMDEEKQSLATRIQELEGDVNNSMKLEDKVSEYKSNVESMKKSVDAQKEIIDEKDREIRKINAVIEALQNDLDASKGKDGNWQQKVDFAKATLEKNEVLWQEEKVALMEENRNASEEVEKIQNEWNNEKNTLEREKDAIFKERLAVNLQLSKSQSETEQVERRMKGKAEDLEQSLREVNMGDTQLRTEIAKIRSKSYNELMDVQLKYEQTEKLNEFKIQNLEKNIEQFEEERRSFRKLTRLWMSSIFRRGKNAKDDASMNNGSVTGSRHFKRNLK